MSTRPLVDPQRLPLLELLVKGASSPAPEQAGVERFDRAGLPFGGSPGARLRINRPVGAAGPLPAYLHLHGGGPGAFHDFNLSPDAQVSVRYHRDIADAPGRFLRAREHRFGAAGSARPVVASTAGATPCSAANSTNGRARRPDNDMVQNPWR